MGALAASGTGSRLEDGHDREQESEQTNGGCDGDARFVKLVVFGGHICNPLQEAVRHVEDFQASFHSDCWE